MPLNDDQRQSISAHSAANHDRRATTLDTPCGPERSLSLASVRGRSAPEQKRTHRHQPPRHRQSSKSSARSTIAMCRNRHRADRTRR